MPDAKHFFVTPRAGERGTRVRMVQSATLVSDTFSEVFKELNEAVQSVTNLSGDTITLDENNGNYWLGAYPDTELITDKSRYPIGILNTPEVDESIIGLRRSDAILEMEVSVYDTRAEHPPKFVEKAVDVLRNNEAIQDSGLHSVRVADSEQNRLTSQRGELTVHEYSSTVEFGFEVCT